jgi:hypothetical protein
VPFSFSCSGAQHTAAPPPTRHQQQQQQQHSSRDSAPTRLLELALHKLENNHLKDLCTQVQQCEKASRRMARVEVDYVALKKKYPRFAVDEVRCKFNSITILHHTQGSRFSFFAA